MARQHSRKRHRQRRPGEPQLDDDRPAGGLLAQPHLHRPVLFREHTDAHPLLARTSREGFGAKSKRLMGTIGDRTALGNVVRMNDWNQYTVIARGGTFLHIVNGQLMAVMIDDDPDSSNNQPGQFGIEIEATTKVSVRNMWLKKLS